MFARPSNSNWLSTVGPNIGAFESEFAKHVGLPAAALSSGTAAIHLCLRLAGVGPGDEVFCSDLTFAASANPVLYLGARPAFLDSERESWNLDPQILSDALRQHARRNRLPRAVVVVHVFGQCAEMDSIMKVCDRYEVPVVEDAAEALELLQGEGRRNVRRSRGILLQRQQDHHDHRRRDAGFDESRMGR